MSFPRIVAGGEPFAAGSQYGKAARTRIRISILNYAAAFAWCGIDWEETKRRARAYRGVIGDLSGDLVDEMRGIADGAAVDFDDILALNVRTELLPATFAKPLRRSARIKRGVALARNATRGLDHPELSAAPALRTPIDALSECTAIAVSRHASADGVSWLAQNWDWMGWQREAVCIVKNVQFITLTEGGMLAKIGVNRHGLAVGLNILRSQDDQAENATGMPVHIVLRYLLEQAESVPAAQKWLEAQSFSSSSNIMAADVGGTVAAFELSPRGCARVDGQHGIVLHTNHFLHARCAPLEGNDSAALSSQPRLACISQTVADWARAGVRPGLPELKAALSQVREEIDNTNGSIARKPDMRLPIELRTESVAGIAIDCATRTLHIAPQIPTIDGFTQIAQ